MAREVGQSVHPNRVRLLTYPSVVRRSSKARKPITRKRKVKRKGKNDVIEERVGGTRYAFPHTKLSWTAPVTGLRVHLPYIKASGRLLK